MTETQQASQPDHSGHAPAKPGDKPQIQIHRVCIGCNQMFLVPMDHYEAKHCSTCHKA